MTQIIEAPTKSDVERIAYQLIHAEQVVEQATGRALTGGIADLALLQATLDANFIEPEATYSLQALGIAFGKVFIENTEFYDWWMVEDEYGRDPAIRYKETTLLVFPQTMISKRVEDGELSKFGRCTRGCANSLKRSALKVTQTPNPSIERTSSGKLRLPPAAAHVKR